MIYALLKNNTINQTHHTTKYNAARTM